MTKLYSFLLIAAAAISIIAGDRTVNDKPLATLKDGQVTPLVSDQQLKTLLTESLLETDDVALMGNVDNVWFEKIGERHYLRGQAVNGEGKPVNIAVELVAKPQAKATAASALIPVVVGIACVPVGETCPRTGCLMEDYGDGNISCMCIPAGRCELKPIIIWLPVLPAG